MDSEDDDDDDDDDLDTHPPAQPVPRPALQDRPSNTTTPSILLIDNLTTLISTLFSRTTAPSAHALLSQLSLTLTTLTRSSGLTVFLLNTLVTKTAKPDLGRDQKDGRNYRGDGGGHSVFAAMKAVPSLGSVFDGFVDLHLMCYALPRGVEDAEGVFGVERADEEEG
ncbi:hypothetical protein V492_08047, partial [Pseudogymnoascus sp. VKM F-4246]